MNPFPIRKLGLTPVSPLPPLPPSNLQPHQVLNGLNTLWLALREYVNHSWSMNKALNYHYSLSEQHTFPSIYHFSKHNTKLNLSNPENNKALIGICRHLDGFERHSYGYIMVFNGKSRENVEKWGCRSEGKWIYTWNLLVKKQNPNLQDCMIYFKLNELNSLIK